jgi:hypothetical protein
MEWLLNVEQLAEWELSGAGNLYSEKFRPSVTLYTINSTCPVLRSTPRLRGGKPASDRLICETAKIHFRVAYCTHDLFATSLSSLNYPATWFRYFLEQFYGHLTGHRGHRDLSCGLFFQDDQIKIVCEFLISTAPGIISWVQCPKLTIQLFILATVTYILTWPDSLTKDVIHF